MPVTVNELVIMLDTNIPGQNVIPFQLSLLHNKLIINTVGLNKYPYFTNDILYPKFYLNALSYQERIQFFFNKTKFMSVLSKPDINSQPSISKIPTTNSVNHLKLKNLEQEKQKVEYEISELQNLNKLNNNDKIVKKIEEQMKERERIENEIRDTKIEEKKEDEQQKNKEKDKDVIITNNIVGGSKEGEKEVVDDEDSTDPNNITNKNILLMLDLIFPTSYPIPNNVNSSYDILFNINEFSFSINNLIPNFLKKGIYPNQSFYSYIKLNSGIYTITNVTWINDIYNHSDYSNLVKQFNLLESWKKKESEKLILEIEDKLKKLMSDFSIKGKYFFNSDNIKYIQDKIEYQKKLYNSNKYYHSLKLKINIDNFYKLMKYINNFNNVIIISDNNARDNEMFKNASTINAIYKELSKSDQTNDNSNFYRKMNEFSNQVNTITSYYFILSEYLQKDGINLNYKNNSESNEDRQIQNILTNKYTQYTNFVNDIYQFAPPIRDTTNKELQKTINNFLNNTNNTLNELMDPRNKYANKYKINTGVSIVTSNGTPQYNIQVRLDLIKGELDDSNKKEIDCMYQGESLGYDLQKIMNESLYPAWILDSNRLYVEMPPPNKEDETNEKVDNISDSEIVQREQEPQSQLEQDKQDETVKYGGVKYRGKFYSTRKLRKNILKTRKRHY